MTMAHRVRFWDLVNAYAEATGGNTGVETVGDRRMDAVAAVEAYLRELVGDLQTKDGLQHQCWFECQGCGKRAPGEFFAHGDHNWHKPRSWFERSDDDGAQTACSRACIDSIASKTGKTSVVLPI